MNPHQLGDRSGYRQDTGIYEPSVMVFSVVHQSTRSRERRQTSIIVSAKPTLFDVRWLAATEQARFAPRRFFA